VGVRFLAEDRFFFSIKFSPALEPTQPPTQFLQKAVSPGLKRKGREAGHSSPYNAEFMNGGAIPHFSVRLDSMVLH
jgi:hypothetical protein